MNVLFDTNVFLDILCKREPFYSDSRRAAEYVLEEKIIGFVSVQSLKDIFYFVSKAANEEDSFKVVERLSTTFKQIGVLPEDSLTALMSDFSDYEDGLIDASAVRSGIDMILTRDKYGFVGSDLLIVAPEDLDKYLEPGATSGCVVIG